MAKKKQVKPKDDEFDDGDLGDLEDEDIDIAVPTLEKKTPAKDKEEVPPSEDEISDDSMTVEELEEFELSLEEEKPIYRFVHLTLVKGAIENDYELLLLGQSHGLCNILVKHLLEIEGVKIAAYKTTGLEPAKIFIRLEKGYNIKKIINQGIETLRDEVAEVQKVFEKLI